jgi:hypothetical protein
MNGRTLRLHGAPTARARESINLTLVKISHLSLRGSTELVKNMIAKERQRTGKRAVDRFHRTEKPRLMRDPRLGGAGRNCHADSETLLQHKPGSKSTHQCRTAMVDDGKVALGKPRRYWAALAAPQRLIRPLMKYFSQHLAGAESAEQYQHGRGSRLEQLSESARHRS